VNISGTDEDIQNRTNILFTAIPPALGETSPVNFDPITLEISIIDVKSFPPKAPFSEGHISAPSCASKFLHALENDQVLLAHPHRGQGPPLQFFSKGCPKLA